MFHATTDIDRDRLLVASSLHLVNWLAEPPKTWVWLRLSDEGIVIAVAHRLGCRACEHHACVCGKKTDYARGLHGLACKEKCTETATPQTHLNNISWRVMKRTQISAVKEPVDLMRQSWETSNDTTNLPWSRGQPLALMPLRVQNHIAVQMHPWMLVETSCDTEFEYYFAGTRKGVCDVPTTLLLFNCVFVYVTD